MTRSIEQFVFLKDILTRLPIISTATSSTCSHKLNTPKIIFPVRPPQEIPLHFSDKFPTFLNTTQPTHRAKFSLTKRKVGGIFFFVIWPTSTRTCNRKGKPCHDGQIVRRKVMSYPNGFAQDDGKQMDLRKAVPYRANQDSISLQS